MTRTQYEENLENSGFKKIEPEIWSKYKGCKKLYKKYPDATFYLRIRDRKDGAEGDIEIAINETEYYPKVLVKWSEDPSKVKTWEGDFLGETPLSHLDDNKLKTHWDTNN